MRSDEDPEDRAPGLARERTDLAWTRTAVSFTALGAAMLRGSPAVGLLVVAVGAAVYGLGYLAARPAPGGRGRLSRGRSAALITLATAGVSVLALAVALWTALSPAAR